MARRPNEASSLPRFVAAGTTIALVLRHAHAALRARAGPS